MLPWACQTFTSWYKTKAATSSWSLYSISTASALTFCSFYTAASQVWMAPASKITASQAEHQPACFKQWLLPCMIHLFSVRQKSEKMVFEWGKFSVSVTAAWQSGGLLMSSLPSGWGRFGSNAQTKLHTVGSWLTTYLAENGSSAAKPHIHI